MDKRYQVFISSTKEDLEEARQEVSQALLRANCFPAAMELFPAADEGIDNYIKQKIDESDYVILILAGRYGSINPASGLSYTEEEYDYAVLTNKPIIRLVHESPFETLPGRKIEQDPERKAKLLAFREKVMATRIARPWDSDRQLGAEVVLGILDAQTRHPALGWTRTDRVATEQAELQIARLEKRIAELELDAERVSKVFDPHRAFHTLPEIEDLPGLENAPVRDLAFLIMAQAFNEYEKDQIKSATWRMLNTHFDGLDVEDIKTDVLDWVLLGIEAAGLATVSMSEVIVNDKFRKREHLVLNPATRTWMAGRAPFNDAPNFAVLTPR